jgi:hypothetical protein
LVSTCFTSQKASPRCCCRANRQTGQLAHTLAKALSKEDAIRVLMVAGLKYGYFKACSAAAKA